MNMLWIILLLILVPIVSTVLIFGSAWFGRSRDGGESWRDRPPTWFTMFRPIINMLMVPLKPMFIDTAPRNIALGNKLAISGYGYAIQPLEFASARWVLAIFFLPICLLMYSRYPDLSLTYTIMLWALLPLAYVYPDIWLNDMVKRRKHTIARDFPFFLELLVLSMRAGLNFSSALTHAADKMKSGALRQEVEYLIRTVRTGTSRRGAMGEMAARVALPQVSNFVAAVNQAEDVGGELGDLLTKQAMQRRKERFIQAEEQANKAPVKMLLPLIGILFPMTFVIIFFTLYIKARDSGSLGFLTGS